MADLSCFSMKSNALFIISEVFIHSCRPYFCLIKQKSLLWYFVKDEYITDDWLKGKKNKMCRLIYVLCAFKRAFEKIGQFLLSAKLRGVSSWLFSNLNQLLVLCMSQCGIRVFEVEIELIHEHPTHIKLNTWNPAISCIQTVSANYG